MAKAKTAVFTITDGVTLNNGQSGAANQVTLDIGHMIDVAESQALEIMSVDFLFQNSLTSVGTFSPAVGTCFGADSSVTVQLSDQNPGTALISATDRSLIASTNLNYGHGDNIFTIASDLNPDSFPTDGRLVVNDTLYLVADPSTTIAASNALFCQIRIRARVVSISKKDWVALALQTGPL